MSDKTLQEQIDKLIANGRAMKEQVKAGNGGIGSWFLENVPKDIEINVDPPSASEAKAISAEFRKGLEKSLKEAWERQTKEGK